MYVGKLIFIYNSEMEPPYLFFKKKREAKLRLSVVMFIAGIEHGIKKYLYMFSPNFHKNMEKTSHFHNPSVGYFVT